MSDSKINIEKPLLAQVIFSHLPLFSTLLISSKVIWSSVLRRSRHRIRLAYTSALQESLDQTGAEGRQRQTVILAQNSPGCLWAATVTVFSGDWMPPDSPHISSPWHWKLLSSDSEHRTRWPSALQGACSQAQGSVNMIPTRRSS